MINTLFPGGWGHFLAGGLLIGFAVGLLFVTTGLVGGMSKVFSSTWSYFSRAPFFHQQRFVGSREWRLVYAAGLIVGAFAWWLIAHPAAGVTTVAPWRLLAGGLLAGYGARLSNGCTSGHGICGLGSFQLPSLLAVLTFCATAMLTAQLAFRFAGR